jgi:hypothetical protein
MAQMMVLGWAEPSGRQSVRKKAETTVFAWECLWVATLVARLAAGVALAMEMTRVLQMAV